MFALSREELGPGNNFGVLLEQGPALPLGHPAPDAELDSVVQGVRAALGDDGTVPANHGGLALGRAADEQLVRVGGSTARLGYPGDTRFRRRAWGRSLN